MNEEQFLENIKKELNITLEMIDFLKDDDILIYLRAKFSTLKNDIDNFLK